MPGNLALGLKLDREAKDTKYIYIHSLGEDRLTFSKKSILDFKTIFDSMIFNRGSGVEIDELTMEKLKNVNELIGNISEYPVTNLILLIIQLIS